MSYEGCPQQRTQNQGICTRQRIACQGQQRVSVMLRLQC